jgi:hypothetical protein
MFFHCILLFLVEDAIGTVDPPLASKLPEKGVIKWGNRKFRVLARSKQYPRATDAQPSISHSVLFSEVAASKGSIFRSKCVRICELVDSTCTCSMNFQVVLYSVTVPSSEGTGIALTKLTTTALGFSYCAASHCWLRPASG